MDLDADFLLLHLSDSALPTGAFAHSFGFETYMDAERITNAEEFQDWLKVLLKVQLTSSDALAMRMFYATPTVSELKRLDERLLLELRREKFGKLMLEWVRAWQRSWLKPTPCP